MKGTIALLFILWALAAHAENPGQVVFSEIMWMGTTASSADEWIELYNRSDQEIDLKGWTITRMRDDGETIMLRLEEGTIAPGGTFLIANYSQDDERSHLAAPPQLVDAALSLPNTKLQLRLYDGDPEATAQLVDLADDGKGAPLAGDSQMKHAMVRIDFIQDGSLPAVWANAQEAGGWDEGTEELGTPGFIPDYLLPISQSTESARATSISSASWGMLKNALVGK
jgi:hypothetical protein